MDVDHFSVEAKNAIETPEEEQKIQGYDAIHQPHLPDELLDQKDRAYIHDGTSKDDVDRWSEDEPSVDAFGEAEMRRETRYDGYEDDEGYKVEEHPDSEEDDFDDEDRSWWINHVWE